MSVFAVKLPDVGEGIAEAELIEWFVRVGDRVTTESPLAEVLTDKASVEISSPVAGVITFLQGEPGDVLAIGSDFVGIEVEGAAPVEPAAAPPPAITESVTGSAPAPTSLDLSAPTPSITGPRPTASPAVRQRARDLGIDLRNVNGTGHHAAITHADLDRHLTAVTNAPQIHSATDDAHPSAARIEPVRGVRRRIAERLARSWTEVPHITYVDEIDATELETLREALNRGNPNGTRLTLLPFILRALVIACREQPRLNAHYDATEQTLTVFDTLHVGIATQTPDGLMVPVVRGADGRNVWETAAEIRRLTTAAREGRATRDELTGSTITVTSLGAIGGLMTTPIINQPEVAIVGVNKMETRPVWRDGSVVPRQLFNLSSSFDHRIVDGWDGATFVQRVKTVLETPGLLFVEAGRDISPGRSTLRS